MPDQPSKADQDLSQQLDALLSEIEQQEPGFAQAAGLAKSTPKPEPQPAQTPALQAAAAPSPALTAEKPADDLDSQIQALLNDAKTLEAASPPRQTPGPAAQTAPPPPPPEVAPEVAAPQAAAQAAQAPEVLPTTAAAPAADPGLMQQIDELLANEADKSVAGEFETVDDVLGDDQVAAVAPIPPEPIPTEPVAAEPEPSPPAPPIAAEPQAGATAKEVAAELDQDLAAAAPTPEPEPESTPAPVPEPKKPAAKTPVVAASSEAAPAPADQDAKTPSAELEAPLPPDEPVIHQGALLRFCTALNAPVRKLPPPSRRIVGYVALLTLFNGSAFTLMALLRSVLGH